MTKLRLGRRAGTDQVKKEDKRISGKVPGMG